MADGGGHTGAALRNGCGWLRPAYRITWIHQGISTGNRGIVVAKSINPHKRFISSGGTSV